MTTSPVSFISEVKEELNPALFQAGKLRPLARKNIVKAIKDIRDKFDLKVRYVWVVGSSISYQYEDDSDIDINIAVSGIDKTEAIEINKELDNNYNEKIFIKRHPVNFKVNASTYNFNFSEAIYDLLNDHWVKKPKQLTKEEVEEIVSSCIPNETLNEILDEYVALTKLLEKWNENKSEEISQKIANHSEIFADIYHSVKEQRRSLYIKGAKRPVSRECISIVFKIIENMGLNKVYESIVQFKEGD